MNGGRSARRVWQTRAAAAVALGLGWVLVVTTAAGSAAENAPLLGVENFGAVLLGVVLVVLAVGVGLLIWALLDSDGFEERPRKKSRGTLVLLLLFVALVLWRPDISNFSNVLESVPQSEIEEPPPPPVPAPVDDVTTVAQANDVLLVLVVIAVLGGVWFAMRRFSTQDQPVSVDGGLHDDLVQAIGKATAELAAPQNPREAVLRAYAALEHTLADRELPRLDHETAPEHLRRALATTRIDPAPLLVLSELYELARFSHREITAGDQQQARQALQRANRQLTTAQ